MVTTNINLKKITEEVRTGLKAKDDLPFITVSGVFKNRNINDLIGYSGIIGMDLDDVTDLTVSKKLIAETQMPLSLLFVSPSGNGLKLFYVIRNARQEDHLAYFRALENYLLKTWSLRADASGKDIPRSCWLCHDPNAFYSDSYIESADLLKYAPTDETVEKVPDSDPAAVYFDQTGAAKTNNKTNADYYFSESFEEYDDNDEVRQLLKNPVVHQHATSSLRKAGWREKKGGRWARPDTDKQSSAVYTYYPPRGCYIFTNFSDNGFPFKCEGYTDIGVISALEYGGDTSQCIQSLKAKYLM